MRHRLTGFVLTVIAGVALSSTLLAQDPAGAQRGAGRRAAEAAPSNAPFDSHDLSGVWNWTSRLLTFSNDVPPRTPWGEEKFNSLKPSYGPRAVPPANGNDPTGNCDPLGIPRLLFFGRPFKIIQGPHETVQFFEWSHAYRDILTDGRPLPKLDDTLDPRWMGYSVGRWDGDTFVVDSVGFDERTWLTHFGDPHSDQMRLEERYRRVDHDTLELTLTLDDPKTYTKPWVSDKKIMKLNTQPDADLAEMFCVPSEEQAFNRRIRDRAAGKTRPQ